jgi:hypothetical protein
MNRRSLLLAFMLLVTASPRPGQAVTGHNPGTNQEVAESGPNKTFLPMVSLETGSPIIANCQVFPADNIWNVPIDTLPVDPNSDCILYEIYNAWPQPNGSWQAGSGAIFDLNSNSLRPSSWTSADAAGLPIFPGLVRYNEIAAGSINHALRFTAQLTRNTFVWPARHFASNITSTSVPPMGQRFRLKSSFDITPFPPEVQVILVALKKYGLILADHGSNWYISGSPDERWNNDQLVTYLRKVKGSDFEAVDVSSLVKDPNSGRTS